MMEDRDDDSHFVFPPDCGCFLGANTRAGGEPCRHSTAGADICKDRAAVRTPRFAACRLCEVGPILSGAIRSGWLALPAHGVPSAEQRLFKADGPSDHRECEPWCHRL